MADTKPNPPPDLDEQPAIRPESSVAGHSCDPVRALEPVGVDHPLPCASQPVSVGLYASGLPRPQGDCETGADEVGAGTVLTGARARYELTAPLGSGGMGSVFRGNVVAFEEGRSPGTAPKLASSMPLPEAVAVKVFGAPEGNRPDELLKRELSALRALNHPNIVDLLDWGLRSPVAFAVLPFHAHGSLDGHLSAHGQLPIEQCWRLLEDILEALAAAHRACLLHLDVKPANVLLDGRGGYLLTDFGISQGSLVAKELVAAGLGTPAFRSPEQEDNQPDAFDVRTDLWGAAATVWAALTGVGPAEMRRVRAAHRKEFAGLPPAGELRPDCPLVLETLVMPMLAVDPAERPGSAYEVLASLRRTRSAAGTPGLPAFADDSTPGPHAANQSGGRLLALGESLMDPLWRSVCLKGDADQHLSRLADGEALCSEGEESYRAFVLLKGAVRIERGGKALHVETREGTFLGEVTALTGVRRTATMTAQGGDVHVLSFNPAEFERFVTKYPSLAIRLIKELAERLQRESTRNMGWEGAPGSG